MKFHDIGTTYHSMRAIGLCHTDYQRFYAEMIALAVSRNRPMERIQGAAELNWFRLKRPFYNVWPGVIPLFLGLKLDIDTGLIKLPEEPAYFRLPTEKNPLQFKAGEQTWAVRTILAQPVPARCDNPPKLLLIIDIGERDELGGTIFSIRNFPFRQGLTLEDSLAQLPRHASADKGVLVPEETFQNCTRLVCGVYLLDQGDSDLIQPVVLQKDAQKFEATGDSQYIERARRRGTTGWHIGRQIERAPHFRAAHLAIYWTGPGRQKAVVKLRGADKPIIVHRRQVEKLPTGFLDGAEHD